MTKKRAVSKYETGCLHSRQSCLIWVGLGFLHCSLFIPSNLVIHYLSLPPGFLRISSLVIRHSPGVSFYLRQMAQNIRCSSLASCQSFRASAFKEGSDIATIRRKNFVSRASLRQKPILCLKSFRETASSASQ